MGWGCDSVGYVFGFKLISWSLPLLDQNPFTVFVCLFVCLLAGVTHWPVTLQIAHPAHGGPEILSVSVLSMVVPHELISHSAFLK